MTFAAFLLEALRWERAYILHIGQSINLKIDQNCLKKLQVKTKVSNSPGRRQSTSDSGHF